MKVLSTQLVWALVMEAAASDLSFSDQSALLDGALREQFGNDTSGYQRFWLQDIFGDYVIARSGDGAIYRIGYTMDGTKVTLADAQEVETAYVPVAEACFFVTESETANADDCVYPVTIMKAGWGKGKVGGQALPHYYPQAFVAQVAEAVNSAKFGRRHPQGPGNGEDDPQRIAGWFSDGKHLSAQGEAQAHLNLLASEAALRQTFSAARQAKKLDLFGLSILADVGFASAVIEGRKCLEARELSKLYSVDLCSEAGAGGKFLEMARVAASAHTSGDVSAAQLAAVKQGSSVHPARHSSGTGREDTKMDKLFVLRVIESLRPVNGAAAAAFVTELNAATPDKYEAIYLRVSESFAAPAAAAQEAANATLAQAQAIQFTNVMESALTESKLPEPAKKLVRKHFEGRPGTTEALNLEILSVREAFAAANTSGRVNGIAIVGPDTAEKTQLAFDRMLGVREAATSGVAAFKGIRAAYTFVTGDADLSRLAQPGGGFFARVSEAVATTDFPNLLLNSMTKRLLQDFKDIGMGGLDQLYTTANVDNYLLQDRVRDGYFGELPIVAEGAPYTEINKPTDERVNYAISNRGNILTISEQTIRNDNLGAIARFPDRLVRAGNKTLKKFITAFFLNNSTYQADSVAVFDSTHFNLASTAFSYDALIAAEIALFNQQEKDSGEALGLTLDWIMVPIWLKAAAIQVNQTNTAGANGFYQRFGANNERIIVNEMLTDQNDWYYGTLPANAPFLEMGFLDGIVAPQIFLANNPTVGTQFTNDQLQYKVKHSFGGALIDFRGVGKSVVA